VIIVGFDPSLKQTGYAFVNERLEIVSAGIIKTSSDSVFERRLYEIFNEAEKMIFKIKPKIAVFEESFYHKNVKTTSILSMVRASLIISCMKNDVQVKFFSPNHIKKSITGNGHSNKEQVQFMVKKIFNLDNNLPDDVSDALAICFAYINGENYELVY